MQKHQTENNVGLSQNQVNSNSNATVGVNRPTYVTWLAMLQRCYSNKTNGYHNYGGRGITVCERWKTSFFEFLKDMGHRPDGYVIDRIDNDGNYEPSNCRWVTKRQSSLNRRNTVRAIPIVNGESAKERSSKVYKLWAEKNKRHRSSYMKQYIKDHKEHRYAMFKIWQSKNKEYRAEYMRKWRQNKLHEGEPPASS